MPRKRTMLWIGMLLLAGAWVSESLASAGNPQCETTTTIVCNESPDGSGVFTCVAKMHLNANCHNKSFKLRFRIQCYLNGVEFGPLVTLSETEVVGGEPRATTASSPNDGPRPTGMGVTYTYTADAMAAQGSSSAKPRSIP